MILIKILLDFEGYFWLKYNLLNQVEHLIRIIYFLIEIQILLDLKNYFWLKIKLMSILEDFNQL